MCLPVDKARTLLLIGSFSVAAETGQSAGKAADALKANLQELEDERKAATLKAEHMATKSQRLAEAIENLQAGALRAMRQRDEAAARELLQVCTICDHTGHDSFSVNKVCSSCRHELSALQSSSACIAGQQVWCAGEDNCHNSSTKKQRPSSIEFCTRRKAEQAHR